MNTWQWSMALGLSASTVFSTVLYFKALKQFRRQAFFRASPPPVIRFGWFAIVAPIVEAWVLFMGGFWNV